MTEKYEYCSTVPRTFVQDSGVVAGMCISSALVTSSFCEFYSLVSIIFMSNRKRGTTTYDFRHKTTRHEVQF